MRAQEARDLQDSLNRTLADWATANGVTVTVPKYRYETGAGRMVRFTFDAVQGGADGAAPYVAEVSVANARGVGQVLDSLGFPKGALGNWFWDAGLNDWCRITDYSYRAPRMPIKLDTLGGQRRKATAEWVKMVMRDVTLYAPLTSPKPNTRALCLYTDGGAYECKVMNEPSGGYVTVAWRTEDGGGTEQIDVRRLATATA